MRTLRWEKVYKGPFEKKEAQEVASELRSKASVEKNGIYDARVRSRKGGKGYDVYIKTSRDLQVTGEGTSTVKGVSA